MYASLSLPMKLNSRASIIKKPWVARIDGTCEVYKYRRVFMKSIKDYTYSAKSGRGTEYYYQLPPGIYEVCYPYSWKHDERYFMVVTSEGQMGRIEQEQVDAWLKNITSE
jgi:hypothetical protein